MSYECSNCCKEIEDEFLVVQENHVILALFNDVENCFCSQECVNDCMWEGTHPAKADDTEFETLHEALAYRATLTGMIEIFKREVIE